ncbi:MAG: bifunctional (p)ppGpp synthetase/guanosine-3',5'-bis(diphosphate) 3'-pyrophosphohydrolase [Clostridia bacterium]|nr:bifunctional (p)ppGpp synthetase/guanosine-3',5'-bis(diphosphate) 3'-pyrophosphohydrolase [Clostridia bacterium]
MLDVIEKLEASLTGKDLNLCLKAYDFAKKAHENQKRASGEDYFIHPCTVAGILVDLGLDAATIAAAFLHDVIEDTPVSEGDIKQEFGDEVLTLVLGVTKLDRIEFTSQEEEQAENFRKLFVAMAKDIRVIIIKLADRLHNMRSLNFLSKERQQRMARETLEIYAPLAGRLGISQIKCELEDLCLKYLEPDFYEYLSTNIEERVKEGYELTDHVVAELKKMLEDSKIKGEVFGRRKHLYSIYRKMQEKGKTLDQIFDLVAIRVIVNTVDECYEIFGKIHNKWKPVPGRIKDYIATPKPNMYRSLHTTVVTNFGRVFEIQIRTYEMNHAAEYGIAAHWKYKEKKEGDDLDTRLSWIREVMEWQGGLKDSKEFLSSLKGDVYSSEVLVFTPKGDVISLPKDATPLDFAYHIHSAIGNKCVGAKVNSKMVPLSSKLQVGDVVEVITSQNSKGPSWDWLKIVKSPSARVKIKQFFKKEMKEDNAKTGRSMLDAEAKRRGYALSELLTEESFLVLSNKMSFSNEEEMFASVGYGAVSAGQVIVKLVDFYRRTRPQEQIKSFTTGRKSQTGGVIVKGMNGLLVRFAGCCNPVPGDEIVGFISRGRGVAVHRKDCTNLTNVEEDRLIEVEWENQTSNSFNAEIKVIGGSQSDILFAVAAATAELQLEIVSTNGRTDAKANRVTVDFTIRLKDKAALDRLMTKLKQDKRVEDVFRAAST